MIYQIKGRLVKKEDNRVIVDVGGLFYEINVPRTVSNHIGQNTQEGESLELIIYHYFSIEKNKSLPVMIGFIEELERDFFERFISVSGVGPRAALKALEKPIPKIAQAIEEGDINFLTTLVGIGKQRAKEIVAHLQGKVGRFALIKEGGAVKTRILPEGITEEAKEILKRLQYNSKEAESMIKTALEAHPQIITVEELLNEIYRQRK